MIFSEDFIQRIHHNFIDNKHCLGNQLDKISEQLLQCTPLERTAIKFFFGSMSTSDLADLDFSVLLEYARFGIFLRENSLWQVPEEIFLNYILHYRVNNEDISFSRKLFYKELLPLIKGKTMKQAALEVNIWCASHMTYRLTDERTISPLTAFRSAYGRCGEESTFVVAALRSIGIPARQVYTPRWAHCDDNHAWVELWCDGEWYFIGACEPEPILNKGWFNHAAARGMLFYTKVFSPFSDEEIISKNRLGSVLNQTRRYAPSVKLTVEVTENGLPLEGVSLRFELINMSESFPIATVITDVCGKASLTLGYGSVIVRAFKDNSFVEENIHTKQFMDNPLKLNFDNARCSEPLGASSFIMQAPVDISAKSVTLTPEQKTNRSDTLARTDNARKIYSESLFNLQKAKTYTDDPIALQVLKDAEGNFEEVYNFLTAEVSPSEEEFKLPLIFSLSKKDLLDVKSDVVLSHLKESVVFCETYPREIFVPYLLCPRINVEMLTPYRRLILDFFSKDQQETFIAEPQKLWEYINQNFNCPCGIENIGLITTPQGVLFSGMADDLSKSVLFVATCRSLGVPARLEPISVVPQFYVNGNFTNASLTAAASNCTLRIIGGTTSWVYAQNLSLAVLEHGVFKTLSLNHLLWQEQELSVPLINGCYRLLTTNRMSNGNILCNKYVFSIQNDTALSLEISLHQANISDMLASVSFDDFKLEKSNKTFETQALLKNKTSILIWLEPGREPTEHILNELLESSALRNALPCEILFVIDPLADKNNKTLVKTLASLPEIKLFYGDFGETLNSLGRRVFVDTETLPVIIITKNGCNSVYASSGYKVGIVELILKIVDAI